MDENTYTKIACHYRFAFAALQLRSGRISNDQGFTLIEILMSLLLLGLALLGYSLLQGQALLTTQQSYWRAQAYDLAEQIIVAIRTQPAQQALFLQANVWDMPQAPTTLACVGRTVCAPTQLAQAHIDAIKTQAFLQLPQGQLRVGACATNPAQNCVVVAWSGSSSLNCNATAEGCLILPFALTAL